MPSRSQRHAQGQEWSQAPRGLSGLSLALAPGSSSSRRQRPEQRAFRLAISRGTTDSPPDSAWSPRSTGGLFGVGVEGLYAQRGFTSSVSGFSQQLSYIDVPVYFKVTIPTGTAVSPYALVGPEVNFEMNCDAGGGSCPSGRDKVTYAGVIGAGVKFGVWTGVAVEGRYAYGLQDLNYSTVSNSSNYRPRSFMLLARVGF